MTPIRLSAFTLCLLAPSLAAAGPVIDARLDAAVSGDQAPQLGTGIGGRVGLPIDVGPIELIPEAGATFWMGDGLVVPDAGARARFGAALKPGVYGHALFPLPTPGGPSRGWDAGASLDFTMLPVDIGLHAGMVSLSGRTVDTTTSFVGGLSLGLTF